MPELTEGPIRWHIYPTWAFDQVFNFQGGMAGVEYFEQPGEWGSLHILGYMNALGEIVIPIEHIHYPGHYFYLGAPPFSEARVAIMCNERGGVGVFDTEGNLIVPFYYHGGWAFSEGLMAVNKWGRWELNDDEYVYTTRWGFIDRYGSVIIPLEFDYATDFSEGLALVMRNEYWGVINTSGELVMPFIIQQVFCDNGFLIIPRISDGLVAVSTGGWLENEYGEWINNERWGFMDMEGNMAIPFQFTGVRDFSNGLASVSIEYEEENAWGSLIRFGKIDVEGNVVLPFIYDWIDPYWGGAIFASLVGGERRIYDRNGNYIELPGEVGFIYPFSEGLAVARIINTLEDALWEDASWGFIDIQGNEVISPMFDYAERFSQGFARVRIGGWETAPDGSSVNNARWGFIDREGNIVVPIEFNEVRNFSEWLAWVRIGDYWGLLQIVED